MKKNSSKLPPRQHRGFAMLEALVSILILSIGVLGMVGMQSAAIRYEQNSWARSAVSMMAGDIAERIRANVGTANNSVYVYSTSYADERTLINGGSAFTLSTDCSTAVCTPDQLASFDLITWRNSLNRLAPGSVGFIAGSSDTAYVVTIAWFDKSWVSSTNVLETAPQCTAAMTQAAARNCCPQGLSSPAGVRCANFAVVP